MTAHSILGDQDVARVQPQGRRAAPSGLAGIVGSVAVGYGAAVVGVAVVTAVCSPFHDHLNDTTVALAFLLVVLFVAAAWRSRPALLASLLGVLAFNFFFLPPLYTFTLADPRNWVALGAFLVTAVTAGQLSERARKRAAEAEAGREYARSLLEASLDPLVTISAEGTITDVNAATEEVTGLSRAELVGTEFSTYFTDPARARAGYQHAFEKGEVTDYALTIRNRRDGRLTDVLYNASVYRDPRGEHAGVFAAARDVTDRLKAEAELRRINRAHRALSSCNQALIRATHEPEWLDQICRIAVEEVGYRLCWIGRAEQDEEKSVRPIARFGLDDGYLERAKISWADTDRGHGPTGTAIREQRPVVAKDFAKEPSLAPWRDEALKRGFASSIAIPLTLGPDARGVVTIYAGEPDAFGEQEVALLTELVDDLGYGLATLRTRAERDRAEEALRSLNVELEARVAARTAELRAAREREAATGARIQQTLLLDEPPRDVRGLRVAALSVPAERIGGDSYGFFRHEDNDCFDVIVADVMGKGVPAALLGAATKSHFPEALWHLMAKAPKGVLPEPKDIVTLAHTHLARHLIGLESFVTACYARFDVANRRLDLVDCGHTGALHFRPSTGACTILHGENLPLGFIEGEIYDQLRVPLEVGDVVLLFSDGVTEARDARGEFFGTERLIDCVRRSGSAEPGALVAAVRDAATAFAGLALADDLTCVGVQMVADEVPVARAELELRSALPELRRAREFVESFCTTRIAPALAADAVASLVLAVDEGAANVMKHAYCGRDDQRLEITAEAFRERVSIRLRYLGAPFDPSDVPPPSFDGTRESGFGVFLIAASVDAVRYYRDDLDRSCMELVKRR